MARRTPWSRVPTLNDSVESGPCRTTTRRRITGLQNAQNPAVPGLCDMRRRGLEPPPGYPGPGPQPGTSTNSAIGARATASIALEWRRLESVRRGRYLVRTHVRRSRGGAEPHGHREGSDEAPAGDLRLHQALLGQPRLPAHGAGHRQGGRARVVVDGPRAPGEPGEGWAAPAR